MTTEGASASPLIAIPRERGKRAIRPRDAASLLLIDRTGGKPHVLMGKRGSKHAFMPDLYVFPGGRRDRGDHALPFSADLHPTVIEKLLVSTGSRTGPSTARALALAAMRELTEETGLSPCAGNAPPHNAPCPDLSCLRYVARAITPPGHVRRFDTRFFLAFTDETGIDIANLRDSEEMADLRWLDMGSVSGLNMPDITRAVLEDVTNLMIGDPSVPFGASVPFYFMRHGRFVRTCE